SETHEHYNLKYCIAQKLKKLNYKVSIEPYIPDSYQYPDLIIDDAIAIEIQFSSEVVAHIVRRSRSLQNIGYKIGRASCRERDWSSDVCSSDLAKLMNIII